MNKTKIGADYKAAVKAYVTAFEKMHDVDTETPDGWNYTFSDIALSFDELKYAVDYELTFSDISAYCDYQLNFYKLSPINLRSFMKIRFDIKYKKGLSFIESDLTIELLTMRLKNLVKK